MNDDETYIAEQIRLHVWSGYRVPEDVQDMVTEFLEDEDNDADEERLRDVITEEFKRKSIAEQSWPDVTDCDKLEETFAQLNAAGVIAVHNAGWDKSDAFHHCMEMYHQAGSPQYLFGICYYNWQDIESAIDDDVLYLGYSSTRRKDEATDAPKAAQQICEELKSAGMAFEWNGDAASRILVRMKWQHRG